MLMAVVGLTVSVARAARAYRAEARSWLEGRVPVSVPADAHTLGLQTVEFSASNGATIRGWYIPSLNGSGVILCHGSGSNRTSMLPHARALAQRGLGVLMIDWPGQGESDGVMRMGEPERQALHAAIDFMSRRGDVEPERIGALGFSLGSYIVAQISALDGRVASVVLEGAFGDAKEQTGAQFANGGRLSSWAASLADRHAGFASEVLRPIDLVGRIAPRPLLVVAGDRDQDVPLELSRRVVTAAGPPALLWIIRGAGHGNYAERDPTYLSRLADHFVSTLVLPRRARGK
jgi:pimeloyl-ACP methyl ester carboxylesterase